MVKKNNNNKLTPPNIFPQHRKIPANKSTHLNNFIELFQWNVFSLMCLEVKPCPCRHSSTFCFNTSPDTGHTMFGAGEAKKETSTLGTPRPYLCHCHLLQYSVQHALNTPYPRLVSSQLPPAAPVSLHKKTQGWGTRSSGKPLGCSSFPWSPQQKKYFLADGQ